MKAQRPMEPLGYDPVDESGPLSKDPGKFYWIMWDKTGGTAKASGRYFDTHEEAWQSAHAFISKNLWWYDRRNFPL